MLESGDQERLEEGSGEIREAEQEKDPKEKTRKRPMGISGVTEEMAEAEIRRWDMIRN